MILRLLFAGFATLVVFFKQTFNQTKYTGEFDLVFLKQYGSLLGMSFHIAENYTNATVLLYFLILTKSGC